MERYMGLTAREVTNYCVALDELFGHGSVYVATAREAARLVDGANRLAEAGRSRFRFAAARGVEMWRVYVTRMGAPR
jgi:hypothetical protein